MPNPIGRYCKIYFPITLGQEAESGWVSFCRRIYRRRRPAAFALAQRLDAIPKVNLPAGLIVFLALSTAVKFYVLSAGSDAEAPPNVIRPDDFAAGSNEKVWKIATVG